MFRISGLEGESLRKKPTVIFVNGLFGDSNFWLANEPKLAPPLVLARKGFDVWLTNSRGSHLAVDHTHLNPKEIEFW